MRFRRRLGSGNHLLSSSFSACVTRSEFLRLKANISNVQRGGALAERKREGLDAWVEEFDFHRSLERDGVRHAADELGLSTKELLRRPPVA